MLEQRHQCRGSEVFHRRVDNEIEECAGNGLGERPPGAVVNLDAPGFKPDGDAPRQQPVGRDQCRRPPRHFDGLAQDQGHDFGFVLGAGGFDQRQAGQGAFDAGLVGAGGELVPAGGGGRGPHGFTEEGVAFGEIGWRFGTGQKFDVGASEAEAVQQGFQSELRMLGMAWIAARAAR